MAMTKRMLADVLWDAANKHLWAGSDDNLGGRGHACFAIDQAEDGFCGPSRVWFEEKFGVPYNFEGWLQDNCGEMSRNERQGVRYMLLLLAMHVAEDEGIEVSATGSAA